jgi:aspartate carbamoyltransferase catalytic subunit
MVVYSFEDLHKTGSFEEGVAVSLTSVDQTKAPPMTWNRKHLLGLEELSREEILAILDTSDSFSEISTRSRKKVPALQGRIVFNLFFEDSTRTRTSFSLAAKRLSADTQDFSASVSSLSKGETFIDTARNIEAMGADIMVVRHSTPGAPHLLAKHVRASVINAGDGAHEHPTQGLLDLMTIRRAKGRIEGLTVALVGDISHSRVARSNIWGLTKLGARVILCGPPTLVPRGMEQLGCEVAYHLDDVIGRCDVVNVLRIQFERQQRGLFPSVAEYSRLYGMTQERIMKAKDDLLVLAPGPINRGVELTPEVADGPHSAILDQVTHGLAVRMAVLYLLSGRIESRQGA